MPSPRRPCGRNLIRMAVARAAAQAAALAGWFTAKPTEFISLLVNVAVKAD